jgi:hypothetical protein
MVPRHSPRVGAPSTRAMLACGALAAALTGSRGARAQQVQKEADVQFEWGLSEMKAGRYNNGCPAIAESYRIDPKPGALFTLAECEARWGRSASALTHYEAYLDLFAHMSSEQQDKQRGREVVSREQKRVLLPRVPELAIQLPSGAPPDTVVKRDGVILSAASLGTLAPVDPGEHLITAEWPGGAAEQRVNLSEGDKLRVMIAIVKPPAVAPPIVAPSATASTSRAQPIPEQESPPPPSRAPVYVAGAVGVAGILTGAVAGIVALRDKPTVDAHCTGNFCDPEGKSAADNLRSAGLVSTVAFAVGIVAAGAAVVLLLLEPKSPQSPVAREGLKLVF